MEGTSTSETVVVRVSNGGLVNSQFHRQILDIFYPLGWMPFEIDLSLQTLIKTAKEAWDVDAYFGKIDLIVTTLASLRSPLSNDDVVTYALNGLINKFAKVAAINTVSSMVTMEELSKLKVSALVVC
ncbi:hypothetical protein Tco_1085847 [Tanacetum coccineum]